MTEILHSVSVEQLQQIIRKIENIEAEKQEVALQLKEVWAEARSSGFDIKILREVLKLRRMKPHHRMEQQAILDTYLNALGMLAERISLAEHAA